MSTPSDGAAKSRCLLVLGMHRSGTSVATRCLNLAGMDVGSHLLTPDDGNSKGYWEHADVVRINDALLHAFGMLWWSLDALPDGWLTSEAAATARVEIEKFVRRDFSGVPLWGLKDPRMCRLAPLWIEVIGAMGFAVAAVFVSRAPLEVARSLNRGHGLTEEAGVIAWMQHLAESELATRGLPRSMTGYEQLLSDPVAALERIGRDLAQPWPLPPTQRRQALEAFVDRGLRTQGDLPGEENIPFLARRLQSACSTIAGGSATGHNWSPLSALCDTALENLRLLDYRARAALPDDMAAVQASLQLQAEHVFVELYHAAEDEEFSEDRAVHRDLPLGRSQVELPLQPGMRYRLDPISHAGYCVVHALMALDARRRVLWNWQSAPDQVQVLGVQELSSPAAPGSPLHRLSEDPQMVFAWPDGLITDGSILLLDIERFDADRMAREFDALQNLSMREQHDHQVALSDLKSALLHQQQQQHDALEALDSRLEREMEKSSSLIQHLDDTQHRLSTLAADLEPIRRGQARQEAALQVLLGRTLSSRLHRRFLQIEFQLMPSQHLESVDAADRRWRVTGNDPVFNCGSNYLPCGAGWYLVSLEMQQHDGAPAQGCLYPDYGPGVPTDPGGLALPFIQPGSFHHQGVVRFSHTLFGLRFDPATSPCEISVGKLAIRRIGRARAALAMLQAVMASRNKPGGRSNWRGSLQKLRAAGVRGFGRWLYASYTSPEPETLSYEAWLQNYDQRPPQANELAREESVAWAIKPLISVLVPVYNSPERWLRRCIESVREQAYPHWELCLANDASSMPHVARILNEYAAADRRIRVVHRPVNGHISATSNSAMALATGEYVALLDHDDELHPLAMFEIVKSLQAHPGWKLIYTDEDKIDEQGHRYDPYMKPDWNYDLLLSQNCISHFGVYQRQLVADVGGFREGFEGSQDWDLALRCVERLQPQEIGHISRVLYHWRAIPGSTAIGVDEKSYARTAGAKAVEEHLQRIDADASVQEIAARQGHLHVSYRLPSPQPRVSLIIPTRDGLHLLKRCVDSILALTTYENYEIVIVDNQSGDVETLQYLAEVTAESKVRVIGYDQPFNYSALNNHAVRQTSGELVGLVNNDIEVISPDWLQEMAGHAMRPEVGAVGAMLYYPNDTIQHAGVLLGVHGVAGHAYCGKPRDYTGQMGRARLAQSMSAVTAACLLIRRTVFDKVGGLDESLRVAFNDIDFCLRVRALGYRNVWTPFAELYHHESATRGLEDSPEKQARFAGEVELMLAKWGEELTSDPAYSPNLTLSGTPFELAFPPRTACR